VNQRDANSQSGPGKRLVFSDDTESEWVRGSDLVARRWSDTVPAERDALEGVGRRVRHDGAGASPQLLELEYPPNYKVEPHAHDLGEIIYVVRGSLLVGAHRVGPGDSVHVPGSTLYSFRAGPDGVCFLNFRPRADHSFVSKAEFGAQRRSLVK
jgi:quercetin dioxygenase-like cupin family protein